MNNRLKYTVKVVTKATVWIEKKILRRKKKLCLDVAHSNKLQNQTWVPQSRDATSV